MIFRSPGHFLGILFESKEKKKQIPRWAGIWPTTFSLMGQWPALPVGLHDRADRFGRPGPIATAADAGPQRRVAHPAPTAGSAHGPDMVVH
jgi:hypothetical protein